jgi:hypothetical protein
MPNPVLIWLARFVFGIGCLLALIGALCFCKTLTYQGPEPFTNIGVRYTAFFALTSIAAFLVAGLVHVLIRIEKNTREAAMALDQALKRLDHKENPNAKMEEASFTARR